MIIEFSTEVREYQVTDPSPEYYAGEPYADRGETGTSLLNVTAAVAKNQGKEIEDRWGESLAKYMPDVRLGDTVHVVVATYQSGDSFGLDGGHTKVLDAFTDFEEAKALRDYTDNISHTDRCYNFTFCDREYYAPWAGYFEHLESVTVWGVKVKPHHDYQFGR